MPYTYDHVYYIGNEFTLFAPTDLGMARYNEMMSIPPGTPGAMAIFYGKTVRLKNKQRNNTDYLINC